MQKWAATAIQMLSDEMPQWKLMKEGRDVYRVCLDIIKDTEWELIVFPPKQEIDEEVEKAKRKMEYAMDAATKYVGSIGQMMNPCNEHQTAKNKEFLEAK